MSHRSFPLSIPCVSLIVIALALGVSGLSAQEPSADTPRDDEPFESWITSLGEPGAGHRILDALVGTWEGTGRIWEAADSEPIPFSVRIERQWVLGGRFLREEVELRAEDGAYEMLGFIGYNNETAQYELFAIDSASTSMLLETGHYNPETRRLTTLGTYRDPATGFAIDRRVETDLSQDGKSAVVGFTTDEEGREYKSLEGTLTRRQP
jgi:hypothetical protein